MDRKPRCVVIDDDLDFIDRVKRTFAAACLDYEVVAFSNSVQAVEFIRSERVDLILTAYLVRQIDGLQLISIVRSFNAHVPILMLSGVPIQAVALARGATAFLTKAVSWAGLKQAVEQLLGAQRRQLLRPAAA